MTTRLAARLTEQNLITTDDFSRAVVAAGADGSVIAEIERLGLVSGPELADAVSLAYGLRRVSQADWPQTPLFEDALNVAFLRENRLLPIAATDATVTVAVADPALSEPLRAIALAVGRETEVCVASQGEILTAIERLFSAEPTPAEHGQDSRPANGEGQDAEELRDLALGAPIVTFVNDLLMRAMHARATDLHIEPFRDRLVLRIRVDGVLSELPSPDPNMARAIVSRIKVLSGLDIGERRLPQDGSKRLTVDGRPMDVRVATLPSIHGESVAIRFLDQVKQVLDLPRLGFSPGPEKSFRQALESPHGLIVVTGPTGSGKTTTLAAALGILNDPTRKILAIEDPVEVQMQGINQVQVKPEIGLTFARALRSFLRHDPDVILVGEMRDAETAQIGMHAALTGHLVMTTLHTNSAAGAVPRLLDMGIDAYLIASSLRLVIGQRLVRVLCRHCRAAVHEVPGLPAAVLAELGLNPAQPLELWDPKGCDQCNNTGFQGRIGIVEVMEVSDRLRSAMVPGVTTRQLEEIARQDGMRSMLADGLEKCLNGITSVSEVRRVAMDV